VIVTCGSCGATISPLGTHACPVTGGTLRFADGPIGAPGVPVSRGTGEVELTAAIEVAVRKLCPFDNNEGYEDEDEGRVMYRCINEDGDAFIETESLAEAVEGIVASYDRVCEAFEAKCEETHRLTAEVQRLRGVVRDVVESFEAMHMPGVADRYRAALTPPAADTEEG